MKIEKKVAGGENELLGTGTIILDGQTYYVLTAAHCFKDDEEKKVIYKEEDLELKQYYEDKESKLEVRQLWIDDQGDDVALITIEEPKNAFDYDNGVKLYAKELENEAYVWGFTNDYLKGRRFKYEIVDHGVWSNKDGIKETGEEPWDILRGTSGGGLIVNVDGVLLCMAIVISTFKENGKLNDITMFQVSRIKREWETAMVSDRGEVNRIAMRQRCLNQLSVDYMKLWDDLYVIISEGKDATLKLHEIIDYKKQYPYPKAVYPQERVINLLFRQKAEWQKSYQEIFLMALADKGQWIGLYGEMPEKANGVKDLPMAHELDVRADTLLNATRYELDVDFNDPDKNAYEKIMRAAFELDFSRMKTLVQSWEPQGFWTAAKSILSNTFENDTEIQKKLLAYIHNADEGSGDEKFIASVAYNLSHRDWTSLLSFKTYREYGLDSPADMLNFMASRIGQKKEQIDIYGIHYSTLFGNQDQYAFPEALRAIQYLMNTGLLPCYNFTFLSTKEDWLKIAKQMIPYMPYPIVFYTLNCCDGKIVKRIAQEMVFSEDKYVASLLPDILISLLSAFGNKSTPYRYQTSILTMAQEMYVAVPEDVWYQPFADGIMKYICREVPLENVSLSDEIYKNVRTAISYIRDAKHRADMFEALLLCMDKNPYLVNRWIDDALFIDKEILTGSDLEKLVREAVEMVPLNKIYLILYKCCVTDALTEELRALIDQKALEDSMDFGHDQAMALCKLSYVVRSKEGLQRIKNGILAMDIWNCGIQGEKYTDIQPAYIEDVNETIDWSLQEWEQILANMRMNLGLITGNKHSEEISRHFNRQYISLLSGMKAFIKLIQKRHGDYPTEDIARDVAMQLDRLRGYASVVNALSSDEYDKVTDGTWLLWNEIQDKGLENCVTGVQMLISRVLLQKKEGLETCLDLLTSIVNEKPEEMMTRFGGMLIEVLNKYSEYLDYEGLAVRRTYVFMCMKRMAKKLESMYEKEPVIDYWLNHKEVNRYAGICV